MKINVNKTTTLLEFLIEQYPDSPKTRIKKIMQSGSIRCHNKTITLHSFQLNPGDTIEINTQAGTDSKAGLPFPVLFEDQYLIVIDKPAGIVTSSTDDTTSVQWIVTQFLKKQSKGKMRAYVVHRLDKEVSGVLLLAKSQGVVNPIKDRWKETRKKYYALVEGKPREQEETLKSWLIEDKSQKVHSTNESPESKYAETNYRIVKQIDNFTLLDINLLTGRKNQIRVHLSDIGCPIVGDRKYGASDEYIRRIRLHAYYLSFPHPVNKEPIIVESPIPSGFLTIKNRNENYK